MQTITPGTTTQHDNYAITDMGTVKIGRTSYRVETLHSASGDELTIKGPRGALYLLRETRRPGVFRPVGLMSGPMVRHGNPVYLTIVGDLIEQTR